MDRNINIFGDHMFVEREGELKLYFVILFVLCMVWTYLLFKGLDELLAWASIILVLYVILRKQIIKLMR